jgi:hypothetical protein
LSCFSWPETTSPWIPTRRRTRVVHPIVVLSPSGPFLLPCPFASDDIPPPLASWRGTASPRCRLPLSRATPRFRPSASRRGTPVRGPFLWATLAQAIPLTIIILRLRSAPRPPPTPSNCCSAAPLCPLPRWTLFTARRASTGRLGIRTTPRPSASPQLLSPLCAS